MFADIPFLYGFYVIFFVVVCFNNVGTAFECILLP